MVLQTVLLTLKLASLTTGILLVVSTPLAWWLSRRKTWAKSLIESLVALPLVLPPTVLGFYLLILFNPENPIGSAWQRIFGYPLTFSFTGLLIGSLIYSLPFVVQPLKIAYERIDTQLVETAALLGASGWDRFYSVILPLAKPGYLTGAILGFAHTVGEFGVVLMIGGNIPGQTQVLAIALYDQVEQLNYQTAHWYAGGLLLASLCLLALIQVFNQNKSEWKTQQC